MRWLRDVAYATAVTASSPVWAWRMHKAGKLRTDWRARFGHGDALPAKRARRLLIHAVSVGEVNAIRMLVDQMSAAPSPTEIVISVTTDTGIARARELYGKHHAVVRYPFDASWMVQRFLDRISPDAVALTELELWPNFVDECRRRRIPVTVVNGRLSARSFARYRRVRPILAKTFGAVQLVLAQNREYAKRFVALGTPADRVQVSGTMKWDTAQIADKVPGADDLASNMGIDRSRLLIVAGSTSPEEHALLHKATPNGVQLLCAPRKPEWFDAAAKDLPGCVRRTETKADTGVSPHRTPTSKRFLLDTIGELRKAYALADVVVIGRTFGTLYGSDMMEPAALGKAIVCGPRTADFQDTADALVTGGAMVQTNAEGLAAVLARLVADRAERERRGHCARHIVEEHQGATGRTLMALSEVLRGGPRAATGAADA